MRARGVARALLACGLVAGGCLTDFPGLRQADSDGAGGTGQPDASLDGQAGLGGHSDGGEAGPHGCDAATETDLAFPTAEGFGAFAKGGRKGKIVRVTNLDDSGEGSLRDALVRAGPRIVVFDVSGTIALESDITLKAAHGFVTVAGQTSPGGIQLKGGGLRFTNGFHNGIVRHLRVRPGGPADKPAIQIYGIVGGQVHDVIIDHCDVMWSVGHLANHFGAVSKITWQWNILAEVLGQGGGLNAYMSGSGSEVDENTFTVHHNLFSQNRRDNPFFYRSAVFDFRNNVVHNWPLTSFPDQIAAAFGSATDGTSAFGNFVANLYLPGSTSSSSSLFVNNGSSISGADRGGTKIFAQGNWALHCPKGCVDEWKNGYHTSDGSGGGSTTPATASVFLATEEFGAPPVKMDAVESLEAIVLAGAGATPWQRDSESQRVVDHVKNRVSSAASFRSDDGGPWPTLTGGSPPADADGDGMPDVWETKHGLNPADASDGAAVACNGWTQVENYLNELAGDVIP